MVLLLTGCGGGESTESAADAPNADTAGQVKSEHPTAEHPHADEPDTAKAEHPKSDHPN